MKDQEEGILTLDDIFNMQMSFYVMHPHLWFGLHSMYLDEIERDRLIRPLSISEKRKAIRIVNHVRGQLYGYNYDYLLN